MPHCVNFLILTILCFYQQNRSARLLFFSCWGAILELLYGVPIISGIRGQFKCQSFQKFCKNKSGKKSLVSRAILVQEKLSNR